MKHAFDFKILKRAILSLLICIPAVTGAAQAASLDKAGAEMVRRVFQAALTAQDKAVQARGIRLEMDGALAVEPAETYYAVTFPHLKAVWPDGRVFDMGILSLNAQPADGSGRWKVTMALPTPMVLLEKNGAESLRIEPGVQKASGIWREDLGAFSTFDSAYENVMIHSAGGAMTTRIGKLALHHAFTKGADGFWSGPVEAALDNIQAEGTSPGAGAFKASLRSFSLKGEVQGYDPAHAGSLGSRMTGASPGGIFLSVLPFLPDATGGFKQEIALAGLSVMLKNAADGSDMPVTLSSARAGTSLGNLRSNTGDLSVRLGLEQLSADPRIPGISPFVPSDLKIEGLLTSFPVQNVAALLKTMAATPPGPASGLAGMTMMLSLPGLLSEAGSALDLPASFIKGADYRVDLSGGMVADSQAANGFKGKIRTVFQGVDRVLEKSRGMIAQGSLQAPQLRKIVEAMEYVKSVARVEQDGAGAARHILEYEMTPDGRFLLNGQPFSIPLPGLGGSMRAVPVAPVVAQ
ncbi:MAG: hypothetical protein K9G62_04565 [Alphaproteobacteria bacterium]|nr:hypothetical protein [Alphaproteobacteria bacterium]